MKKFLFSFFLLIPLTVISCNNSNGFNDPFPNDAYKNKKIGFKIADIEKTSRSLTTLETTLIENTINKIDTFDSYINKTHKETHVRSYLKAFAGDFAEGANVKNELSDKTEDTQRYEYNDTSDPINPRRLKTVSTSSSTEQYSYGEVSKSEKLTTYIHEEKVNDTTREIEDGDTIDVYKTLVSEKGSGTSLVTKVSDEIIGNFTKGTSSRGGDDYYVISQKNYIREPDIHSGANNNNEIVLILEEKVPYPGIKSGFIKLKNQKEYAALNNTISVSKLELKTASETTSWSENWYLASYVRKYTETVITSEVIEPNVPVTYLKNPIVIGYTEEIINFYADDPAYIVKKQNEIPLPTEKVNNL